MQWKQVDEARDNLRDKERKLLDGAPIWTEVGFQWRFTTNLQPIGDKKIRMLCRVLLVK